MSAVYLTLLPKVEYMLTNVAEPHADVPEFLVDPRRTNPEGRGKFVSFAALPEARDGINITKKDSEHTLKKSPPAPNPKPLGTIDTSGIRKIYRPKLPSRYKDVDLGADELKGMDVLFKDWGQALSPTRRHHPFRREPSRSQIGPKPQVAPLPRRTSAGHPRNHQGILGRILRRRPSTVSRAESTLAMPSQYAARSPEIWAP